VVQRWDSSKAGSWALGGCGRRHGGTAAALNSAGQEGREPRGIPSTQVLTGLVDSPGKGDKGPGARA
jgi:hypothetical protein